MLCRVGTTRGQIYALLNQEKVDQVGKGLGNSSRDSGTSPNNLTTMMKNNKL